MSKRISSALGTFHPKKAAEHLKKYISENNFTISGFADFCYIDRRTISDIKKATDKPYNEYTFTSIGEHTGIGVSYWTGLNDVAQPYELELQEAKERKKAERLMGELEKRLAKEHSQYVDQLCSFFSICGFAYEQQPDFNDKTGEPECIHILDKDGKRYKLTDQELDALITRIKLTIDFSFYEHSLNAEQ